MTAWRKSPHDACLIYNLQRRKLPPVEPQQPGRKSFATEACRNSANNGIFHFFRRRSSAAWGLRNPARTTTFVAYRIINTDCERQCSREREREKKKNVSKSLTGYKIKTQKWLHGTFFKSGKIKQNENFKGTSLFHARNTSHKRNNGINETTYLLAG